MTEAEAELLELNHRLLASIANADWNTYQELCDPKLTAFEPEAHGQLVEGLEFHYFYFDLEKSPPRHQTTMINPHVRILGDMAVVAFVRVNQKVDRNNETISSCFAETRVWHKHEGRWRHVHFHRTALGGYQ